ADHSHERSTATATGRPPGPGCREASHAGEAPPRPRTRATPAGPGVADPRAQRTGPPTATDAATSPAPRAAPDSAAAPRHADPASRRASHGPRRTRGLAHRGYGGGWWPDPATPQAR